MCEWVFLGLFPVRCESHCSNCSVVFIGSIACNVTKES